MLDLTEAVYVTDRQLRVFRDTLDRRVEFCLKLHDLPRAECLADMREDLEDELDRRAALRENGR